MALTQAQWYSKLVALVPSWYFENERLQRAHFQALAKVMAQVDADADAYVASTFLLQSSAPYLDQMGDERGVDRVTDELDSPYALRIQSLANPSNKPAIKALVDSLLRTGECEIREGFKDLTFLNRGAFLDRDEFFTLQHHNFFTIVLDPQAPPLGAFANRENFLDRQDFVGDLVAVSTVYDSIVSAVDKAKAFGVLYSIVER